TRLPPNPLICNLVSHPLPVVISRASPATTITIACWTPIVALFFLYESQLWPPSSTGCSPRNCIAFTSLLSPSSPPAHDSVVAASRYTLLPLLADTRHRWLPTLPPAALQPFAAAISHNY
ncbi:hypothetical protein B296_00011059, partial [Ensete ventricosum]